MYVILASNSAGRVSVYGKPSGKPYDTRRAAENAQRRLARNYPRLDFLVLPINATDALMLRASA